MTTKELVNYYANLLILQYRGKPKAYATIQATATPIIIPQTTTQTIVFSPAPTAGTFKLSLLATLTGFLNWNDSAATIQTALQVISSQVTVTGSIASGLTITLTGIDPVADLVEVENSTLTNGGNPVAFTITETDETLPNAIQNAFNLNGSQLAQGVQLDILGKYAGVSRSGNGFSGPITLDDDNFYLLIKMAIAKNTAGSSLEDIDTLLNTFFPGEILAYDYTDMRMSYLVSTALGSQDLIQLFITEGLLPRPMGVQLASVVYVPILDQFFGFGTYEVPAYNVNPFNTYSNYHTDWPWLSYANGVGI